MSSTTMSLVLANADGETASAGVLQEITNSRKALDLSTKSMMAARFSQDLAGVVLTIQYSTDNGSNWATLVSGITALGAGLTTWTGFQKIPAGAKTGDILIRCLATLALSSTRWYFVELEVYPAD